MARDVEGREISITSDEINCLVYAYLQDSGFAHSAFALRSEAHLDRTQFANQPVRRGELIDLLAKALLYSEVEAHWRPDHATSTCKAPFSLLSDHICSPNPHLPRHPPIATHFNPREILQNGLKPPINALNDSLKQTKLDSPEPQPPKPQEPGMDLESSSRERSDADSDSRLKIPITLLQGHATEVFVCSWNPTDQRLLATGAKDGVIRLWRFKSWDDDAFAHQDPSQQDILSEPSICLHQSLFQENDAQADVTSIEWNQAGTLLASGSFDGYVRVWTANGEIYLSQKEHSGPVFSVKFSPSGKWLLTAGLDGNVDVWDVTAQILSKQVQGHNAPCLDVDWLDETTFVTGSADTMIHVFNLSYPRPLAKFLGHSNEVNQIKCNKSRTLLASCSDDGTARIWDVSNWNTKGIDHVQARTSSNVVTQSPLNTLIGHTESIGSISWCPSNNENEQILATAAFDTTCRLWDALTGACLRVFADNSRPVFTLNFSTDGEILATGGGDGLIQLYDVKSRNHLWKWQADLSTPGVFEIEWQEARRVAVCLENQSVAFIDLSRVPNLFG